MQNVLYWLENALHLTVDLEVKILSTVIIFVLVFVMRWAITLLINHQLVDTKQQHHWHKTATYVLTIFAVFLIARTWLFGVQSLATFLGLLSAGLAIAFRDPLTSIVAWLYIISMRPFSVGDRIQLGHHAGDIIDFGLLNFVMLEIGNWVEADQSTGRILYIPNGQIFNHPLANYSHGLSLIWHEIQVNLTFESNWEKAKALLHQIANQHAPQVAEQAQADLKKTARRYVIMYQNFTPIVYTNVVANGIALTIRYLCPPRRRRSIEQAMWEAILRAFRDEPDIEFAYPTQRFYQRNNASDAQSMLYTPPDTTLPENNFYTQY
jgi:small-conductance mechanosensitive channel